MESNVAMLIATGFEFTSTRLGEHWKVSEEEVKAISEPSTRILQRLGINETASKYMDYFALLAGIGMVVVPRILIGQAQNQQTPKLTEVKNIGNKKGQTKKSNPEPNRPVTQESANVGSLKSSLAIMD